MRQQALDALWLGYGQMGRALALRCRELSWINSVGVVEPRLTTWPGAQVDLGLAPAQIWTDLPKALKHSQPKLVLINTPSEQHYRQAALALAAQAHVLVAKPSVSTISQAHKLLDLSLQKKRKVAVGQQMRFNRHYRAVAELIGSGELGRISRISFSNSKPRPKPFNLGEMVQPAMLEMACHHFDCIFALLPKAQPLSIVARGYKPAWSAYRANSMVDALIELSGDVHVNYHGGFDAQAPCYELRVEGSRGTLRARGEHMSASNFSYEIAPALGQFSPVDLESQVPEQSPWLHLLELWRRWLRGGREPVFSLRKNLPVFALLQAGMESIRRESQVDLSASSRYRSLIQKALG